MSQFQKKIETSRLILRRWEQSDAASLFRLASDPEVGPLAGWAPHKNLDESLSVIRNFFMNDWTWAITLKGKDEPIGCISYFDFTVSNIGIGEDEAEVGYWIGKPYWNQGYATEALSAMVDLCLNKKGFKTLWGDCYPDNVASKRVMEKCGFNDTGKTNYCSHLYHGDEQPVHIMRLDIC